MLSALKRYGLPMDMAYYIDDFGSPPPPPLPPPSPPPPSPPPPVADWTQVDVGESIAVDVPFNEFTRHNLYYETAFTMGLSEVLFIDEYDVYVNDLQPSSIGTTIILFDLALPPAADSSTESAGAASTRRVRDLFAPPTIGSPAAKPMFVSRLRAYGMPVTQANYGDQLAPSDNATADHAVVQYWTTVDEGEAVALDIPFDVFQQHAVPYMAAFARGAATAFKCARCVVDVETMPSALGNTVVFFKLMVHGNTNMSVAEMDAMVQATHAGVASLFHPDFATGEVEFGSPAFPQLLDALLQQGLPITGAWYEDQLPAYVGGGVGESDQDGVQHPLGGREGAPRV
jgi:hypothetical protein